MAKSYWSAPRTPEPESTFGDIATGFTTQGAESAATLP